MRNALTVLVTVAVVAVGCGEGATPTPTPTTAFSADEAYLEFFWEVVRNEMAAYNKMRNQIHDSVKENPLACCIWADEEEDVTKRLKYALWQAPHPQHPSLQKHRAYMLEAMDNQLLYAWYLHKACASMNTDDFEIAIPYQDEVTRLLGCANDALDEYERSQ